MILLENIRKLFHVGNNVIKAVDGVSIDIPDGDFVALRGPSGSGKSTIMNIIGCLDHSYEGAYNLNDQDISHMEQESLAKIRNRLIGFVHQNFNLLPRLSALENVELPLVYAGIPKSERIGRAKKCLAMVGLSDREQHLPIQLSGGQLQRVAIARAIVNNALLILADEPTGNLDSKSSVEIMTILERLNEKGTTIILVTHEASVAEYARRSIFLKDGKLESE